jgi:L-rhamnose mutarotase
LQNELKAHGAGNYSIFLDEETGILFGYVEIQDEEQFQQIAQTEVCRRWWRYMAEVLVCESDDSPKGKEVALREVFHLD